jgi:hypothetical protein
VGRTAGLDDARGERLRGALASIAAEAGGGERCPSADRLWDSAGRRLSRGPNEEVILHLGECGACASAWRLARDLGAAEAAGSAAARPAVWPRRAWIPLATAAALGLLVVGLATRQRLLFGERPAEYREPTAACAASLLPQAEPLRRGSCLLRWSACPEGTTYDVRVSTEDLELVVRARELDRPEFVVPGEALSAVPDGGRIIWQVTAHLPDGGVSESASYRNEVR